MRSGQANPEQDLPNVCPYRQEVCAGPECNGTVPVGLPWYVPLGTLGLGLQLKMCPRDPRFAASDANVRAAVLGDEQYQAELQAWLEECD